MTTWIISHIASGQSFFSGITCLLVAVGITRAAMTRRRNILRNILVGLGGALVFVSVTPLPLCIYAVLFAEICVWLALEIPGRRIPTRRVHAGRFAVLASWLGAGLIELPAHRMPRVPLMGRPVFGVIGDSLTAGTGDETASTWPKLLARDHGVAVRDHSVAGATVGSAIRQAAALSPEERLVLLEIGGNDILGVTTPGEFETRLDQLLAAVDRPGRVVLMLELPLPPTFDAYGQIQRRLARRYQTRLVPRRVLMSVLQDRATTIDTIHLSANGHQAMVDAVWRIIRPAFGRVEDD